MNGEMATAPTLPPPDPGVGPPAFGVFAAFSPQHESAPVSDSSKITSLSSITIGPARFISHDAVSPIVYALVMRLDVFTIWATVLIGIGLGYLIARAVRR